MSDVNPNFAKHGEMNPLFIFCHGAFGCGTNVWFPFAFTTVAEHDCDFISPDLPNPLKPQYEAWKDVLLDQIKSKWNKKQPIILVGHSLGGYTLLRLLSDCPNEDWAHHVKGFYLVSPVVSMKLTPFLHGLSEINFEPILKMPIKFRHIYNVNDIELNPKNSELLQKIFTDAKVDYKVEITDANKYNSHFGGLKHYPCKEINDGIISLLHEVDPKL